MSKPRHDTEPGVRALPEPPQEGAILVANDLLEGATQIEHLDFDALNRKARRKLRRSDGPEAELYETGMRKVSFGVKESESGQRYKIAKGSIPLLTEEVDFGTVNLYLEKAATGAEQMYATLGVHRETVIGMPESLLSRTHLPSALREALDAHVSDEGLTSQDKRPGRDFATVKIA